MEVHDEVCLLGFNVALCKAERVPVSQTREIKRYNFSMVVGLCAPFGGAMDGLEANQRNIAHS